MSWTEQRGRMDPGLRESEQGYRELFENNPQPTWVRDCDTLEILAVNEAAVRHYGYSHAEFRQLTLKDLQPALLSLGGVEGLRRAATVDSLPELCRHRKKDGTFIDVEVVRHFLVFDGRPAAIELCCDVSERTRAARQAVVFSELGRRLSAASTPREAARLIAEAADALFGWDACCLDLSGPDPSQVNTLFCTDTVNGHRVETEPQCSGPGPLSRHTLAEGPQLISRTGEVTPFEPGEQPFGDIRRRSRSLMFVPVRNDERAVGVFSIQSYAPNAYAEKDLLLLEALADHCGAALERIRAEAEVQRLNRELRHRLEELQTIFEAAPVGLAVASDPECRQVTGNPAYRALLGLGGGEQPEMPPLKFKRRGRELSPEELPMRRAAREAVPVPAEELELVLTNGQTVSAYASASPLYDETGRVRGSLGVFVDLSDRKQSQAALQERDERLRLALAASRMGAWTLELASPPRLYSSPELETIFGFPPREVAGSLEDFFKRVHLSDREMVREAINKALTRDGDYEIEFRFLPRHRPMGWLLARGRAYPAEAGRPRRLAGVGIDITAHKEAQQEVLRLNAELERRVQERTAQLEAINNELEAFSYSVSHDLRAPLRSIRGFSEVLLQRYSDCLDSRGQEFLRRACQSSEQMDKLIDDLLELSRVGRAELRNQPVNLAALAASVVADLQAADPERHVEFIAPAEAPSRGDERLLKVVLQNLLHNAWKFTSRQPAARIEFGLTNGPETTFFVRDNGAGFDMAYLDRLFRVFQRLHSGAEFPGTGVGLATVQRIINRHGGRIWAQGSPGQGATFFFTLPAHEPA